MRSGKTYFSLRKEGRFTTSESYAYDAVGNRTSSLSEPSYNVNVSNELTSTSNAVYTYDNNGNELTKVDSTGTTSYTWDFENRLMSVTLPGGTVQFSYDPFGRRIKKASSAGTSIFAYDGDNLIEETNASGAAVARYSQTNNIDEPLAMLRGGATNFYHADGLVSVTSLSDAAGALAQVYTSDSFGKTAISSGALTNPFRFVGREFDPETGLYFYRARYYDPLAGRFLSQDPSGFRGSGTNFYAYVRNSSVDLVDPLGLCAKKKDTANCVQNALQDLFPDATASVGDATKEVGGHWNFPVQLQFSSEEDALSFYDNYATSAQNGFKPPARFGHGPALHLENLTWGPVADDGTYTAFGTAHIDLFNPNGKSQGGGGVGGLAGHVGIDGLVGHIVQALGGNIDLANCPW